MLSSFLQFLFSGLTSGAVYALAALGFTIIYNSSQVINFAQGEFIMIGGLAAATLTAAGMPLPVSIALAVLIAVAVGILLEKFAIEPARNSSIVSIIIITIGAAIFIRGLAQIIWGKNFHTLPPFSSDQPIHILGATLMPQSLWVLGIAAVAIVFLWWFFNRTLFGKGMLAASHNRLAAQLVGIEVKAVLVVSFALAAFLGAIGGIVITPITFVDYETGVMLGLKGFTAAVLGGLGSSFGAIAGGLVVGIAEAMAAGYISSAYKDAIAFLIILLVLFFLPNGMFGGRSSERV